MFIDIMAADTVLGGGVKLNANVLVTFYLCAFIVFICVHSFS